VDAALTPVATMGSHETLIFLLQLGVLLGAALGLGRLAMRWHMPAVIGELCVGIVLGPSLLSHVAPGFAGWLLPHDPGQLHLMDAVGQVGVLLLVGLTGIHLDLGLLRRQGLTAFRVSAGGLLVPLGLGVGVGFLLPAALLAGGPSGRTVFALFIGVALCVSAIPVIAKILLELNLVHRNVGQLTLSAAAVDDVIGWFLLSVVSAMATTGVRTGTVLMSLAGLALVVLVAVLVGRPLVRGALRLANRSAEAGPTVAVVVVLVVLASAATHAMKLEAILGAFVCGLVISSSGALSLERLAPLRTFVMAVLAPLFFAVAGLRMDLTALRRGPVLIAAVVVLVVAVVGKFAGAYLGAMASRLNRWEGLAVGAGLNARGVVQVIVAMVGLRLEVLNTETYTIIVLVAIVTSLMAGPTLRYAVRRIPPTADEHARFTRWALTRL
jgi:Kef-type K+ transport system membrane component KefB